MRNEGERDLPVLWGKAWVVVPGFFSATFFRPGGTGSCSSGRFDLRVRFSPPGDAFNMLICGNTGQEKGENRHCI